MGTFECFLILLDLFWNLLVIDTTEKASIIIFL